MSDFSRGIEVNGAAIAKLLPEWQRRRRRQ